MQVMLENLLSWVSLLRDNWNAVKARFGGNAKSKKIRKSMLKQEFLEFKISKAEGLHKGSQDAGDAREFALMGVTSESKLNVVMFLTPSSHNALMNICDVSNISHNSTSRSDDEEYDMAVRNFKSSLEERVNLLGNQEKKRSHSDKGMKRKERVTRNVLDAVIQIISLVIVQSRLATKITRPSLEATKMSRLIYFGNLADSLLMMESKWSHTTLASKIICTSTKTIFLYKIKITKHKGKEIAKPVTPPSESKFDEESDPEQAQKDKEMQTNLALIAKYFKKTLQTYQQQPSTSSNSKKGSQVVQQTRIQCSNCKEFRDFTKEWMKPKQVKDYTYHKENMLLCKQSEKGVPLQADYMAKIQEVLQENSDTTAKPLTEVFGSFVGVRELLKSECGLIGSRYCSCFLSSYDKTTLNLDVHVQLVHTRVRVRNHA
nr:xylulose kinase-1 [Tanacetum cinerariifolium]